MSPAFRYDSENMKLPTMITMIKINTGRNVSVVRMPANLSFLRTYAIHAAIAKVMGQIGYDQTAITKVQASGVEPESNAITESPAAASQNSRDPSARSCEMMSQIKIGLRVAGLVSK